MRGAAAELGKAASRQARSGRRLTERLVERCMPPLHGTGSCTAQSHTCHGQGLPLPRARVEYRMLQLRRRHRRRALDLASLRHALAWRSTNPLRVHVPRLLVISASNRSRSERMRPFYLPTAGSIAQARGRLNRSPSSSSPKLQRTRGKSPSPPPPPPPNLGNGSQRGEKTSRRPATQSGGSRLISPPLRLFPCRRYCFSELRP